MNKLVYILLSIFVTFFCNAQTNLVPNPSFENYSSCPIQQNDPITASNWYIASQSGTSGGTSDYFNTCSDPLVTGCIAICATIPQNQIGYQYPRTGNGYCGFGGYTSYFSVYKEYIGTKLKTPLKKGKTYCVSFYVSLADSCLFGIKQVGAYFSNDSCPQLSFEAVDVTPQIENSNGYIDNKTDWTEITGSFTATDDFKFLCIGSFGSSDSTDVHRLSNHGDTIFDMDYKSAYYYVDDVTVLLCNEELNIPNVFSPNDDGINDFFLIPNLEVEDRYKIYDRWGILIFDGDYKTGWDGKTKAGLLCPAAVYYYITEQKNRPLQKGFIQLIR